VSSFSNVSSLKSTQECLSLDVEVFSHRKKTAHCYFEP